MRQAVLRFHRLESCHSLRAASDRCRRHQKSVLNLSCLEDGAVGFPDLCAVFVETVMGTGWLEDTRGHSG